jgi:hypothetical protein
MHSRHVVQAVSCRVVLFVGVHAATARRHLRPCDLACLLVSVWLDYMVCSSGRLSWHVCNAV